jgi:hypothetical protein
MPSVFCPPSCYTQGKNGTASVGSEGAGGGKVLDTARTVAADLGLPVVSCPTLASGGWGDRAIRQVAPLAPGS